VPAQCFEENSSRYWRKHKMKQYSQNQISQLLSQYLDGISSEEERKEIEGLIASDAKIKAQFDQLNRMHDLLAGKKKIEPNVAFWTRLSASLPDEREEENLLPFPRQHIPTAAIAGIIGIVLIGVVIFQNRMPLFHYVTEKSQMVQSAYEQGILKGSILPLLSHIDENQVLQFSLLGILPLDAKAETALKVEQGSSNGYQIKLGKTTTKEAKPLLVKDFYAQIQATNTQRKVIDSLVGLARKRIETSVLVSENQGVAIDPELAQLNRVMVTNIAASLEPVQRIRFGKFLEKRNAPYTFISRKFVPVNPESIFVQMGHFPHPDRFVVMTADTVAYARVETGMIRAAEHSAEVQSKSRGMVERNLAMTQKVIRQFADRELRRPPAPKDPSMPFNVWVDANTVGIQFQREMDIPRWEPKQPGVIPFPRHSGRYTVTVPSGTFEFVYRGDSVSTNEMMIDSAMVRFFNMDNPSLHNLRAMDSIFSGLSSRFRMQPGHIPMDSIVQSLQDAQRRMFEERDQRRRVIRKEVRVNKEESPQNEE
jgi:hypothetical protein